MTGRKGSPFRPVCVPVAARGGQEAGPGIFPDGSRSGRSARGGRTAGAPGEAGQTPVFFIPLEHLVRRDAGKGIPRGFAVQGKHALCQGGDGRGGLSAGAEGPPKKSACGADAVQAWWRRCRWSRRMMASRFMPSTSRMRTRPVPYWSGRVFSMSVPAVASTYMW